jgi:hypothetical protein
LDEQGREFCDLSIQLRENIERLTLKQLVPESLSLHWQEALQEIESAASCSDAIDESSSYDCGVPLETLAYLVAEIAETTDGVRRQLPTAILSQIAEDLQESLDRRAASHEQQSRTAQRAIAKNMKTDIGIRTFLCITRYLDSQPNVAAGEDDSAFRNSAHQEYLTEIKQLIAHQGLSAVRQHFEQWRSDERVSHEIHSGADLVLKQLASRSESLHEQARVLQETFGWNVAQGLSIAAALSEQQQETVIQRISNYDERPDIFAALTANPKLLLLSESKIERYCYALDDYGTRVGLTAAQLAEHIGWVSTPEMLASRQQMLVSNKVMEHDFEFAAYSIENRIQKSTNIEAPEIAACLLLFGFSPVVGKVIQGERLPLEVLERNMRRHRPEECGQIGKRLLSDVLEQLSQRKLIITKRVKGNDGLSSESNVRYSLPTINSVEGDSRAVPEILSQVVSVHEKYRPRVQVDVEPEPEVLAAGSATEALEQSIREQAEKERARQFAQEQALQREERQQTQALTRLYNSLQRIPGSYAELREAAESIAGDLRAISLWESQIEGARLKHLQGNLRHTMKANPVEQSITKLLHVSANRIQPDMQRNGRGPGASKLSGRTNKGKGAQFRSAVKTLEREYLLPIEKRVSSSFSRLRLDVVEALQATDEAISRRALPQENLMELRDTLTPLRDMLFKSVVRDRSEYVTGLSEILLQVGEKEETDSMKVISGRVANIAEQAQRRLQKEVR